MHRVVFRYGFLANEETFCVYPVQLQAEQSVDDLFINTSLDIRVLHRYLI